MRQSSHRRLIGFVVALGVLLLASTAPFRQLAGLPSHMRIMLGEETDYEFGVPIHLAVKPDQSGAVSINGLEFDGWKAFTAEKLTLTGLREGQFHLDLRLLGLIPIRSVSVDVVPSKKLLPGGQSIGIQVESQGVMIVRETGVWNGRDEVFPAREADLRVGDLILAINGQPVQNKEHAGKLLEQLSGKEVHLRVRRGNRVFETRVSPVYDERYQRHLLGVWIRDGASGVGTLTFMDTDTMQYGALGHMITDSDTTRPYPMREGAIYETSISGIRRGREGYPGEKIGVFRNMRRPLGNIEANTAYGIFGSLTRKPEAAALGEPLTVGLQSQIHPGPAQIITVVEGEQPELFEVQIERVAQQNFLDGRSMILRVTDPRLLNKTGGIVQGMSGSPIIQDGRLIGAVTHVFVQDPTRGYGISIELMLRQLQQLQSGSQDRAS